MGKPQHQFPSKEAVALAEALKRGRDPKNSRPKATIEDICKALGIERSDLKPDAPKPSVTLFINRPQP